MDTIGEIMTPLEIMHEVFDKYKYEYDRPNYLPNNRQICDNPLLVQFLVQYFFDLPDIMDDDVEGTWDIYNFFNGVSKKVYEGRTQDMPQDQLKVGDVLIFSVNSVFDEIAQLNYWCGMYYGTDHFLNFNGLEGFGDAPLSSYLSNPNYMYDYVVAFRPTGYDIGGADMIGHRPNP